MLLQSPGIFCEHLMISASLNRYAKLARADGPVLKNLWTQAATSRGGSTEFYLLMSFSIFSLHPFLLVRRNFVG